MRLGLRRRALCRLRAAREPTEARLNSRIGWLLAMRGQAHRKSGCCQACLPWRVPRGVHSWRLGEPVTSSTRPPRQGSWSRGGSAPEQYLAMKQECRGLAGANAHTRPFPELHPFLELRPSPQCGQQFARTSLSSSADRFKARRESLRCRCDMLHTGQAAARGPALYDPFERSAYQERNPGHGLNPFLAGSDDKQRAGKKGCRANRV